MRMVGAMYHVKGTPSILKQMVLEVEQENEEPTLQSIVYNREDESEWAKVEGKKKKPKATQVNSSRVIWFMELPWTMLLPMEL
jgi:hypothetical protein